MATAPKKNLLSLQTKVTVLQEVEKFAKERSAKMKIVEKNKIPKSTLSTISLRTRKRFWKYLSNQPSHFPLSLVSRILNVALVG